MPEDVARLTLNYYDREQDQTVFHKYLVDVVEVLVPSQKLTRDDGKTSSVFQPEVWVVVSTDAVLVHARNGKQVVMHKFTELLAEAGFLTCVPPTYDPDLRQEPPKLFLIEDARVGEAFVVRAHSVNEALTLYGGRYGTEITVSEIPAVAPGKVEKIHLLRSQ